MDNSDPKSVLESMGKGGGGRKDALIKHPRYQGLS